MPIAAPLIIGGATLGAGALGYMGAKSAANAQVSAEQAALAAQNQARAKLDPWINVGTGANNQLGGLFGIGADGSSSSTLANYSPFYSSPDYQFALQQGNLGLQAYENANGLAGSGGALTAASQFNQGLAAQQYGNYFNRLMQLSQLGQGAASAGVGGANAAAGTMGAIGQSQASGIIGGTNALSGGINSGVTNSLLYNAINRTQGGQTVNPSSYASPSTFGQSATPVPYFGATPTPFTFGGYAGS